MKSKRRNRESRTSPASLQSALNSPKCLITFDIHCGVFCYTAYRSPKDSGGRDLGGLQAVTNTKKAAKEDPSTAQVQKLAEQMRFRLKEAMAQRGDSEAFLHWLQTDNAKKA
jgi:hypothetical protein